jgi:hypothetical protein
MCFLICWNIQFCRTTSLELHVKYLKYNGPSALTKLCTCVSRYLHKLVIIFLVWKYKAYFVLHITKEIPTVTKLHVLRWIFCRV